MKSLLGFLMAAALVLGLAFIAYWLLSWIFSAVLILLLAGAIGYFLFFKGR